MQLFRKINNIFHNDQRINEFKNKLQNNQPLPRKYHNMFALNQDNDLVYLPKNLVIIPHADKEQFIKDTMENNLNIIGHGITAIYKFLCRNFGNITREDVEKYIKQDKQHVILQNPKRLKAKPITADRINLIWQIDLIDMDYLERQNDHYKYILNCVDIYSRYCFLRGMRNKEANTIMETLDEIMETTGQRPRIIQTDQGSEFKGVFDEYLKDNDIKHIFNHSYSPNQNTYVERSNKDIRKLINTTLTIMNSKRYIDVLNEIERAKNTTYNKNLKCAPRDLYNDEPNEQYVNEVKQKNDAKMEKYKESDHFQVGDHVLVRMSCIFSQMRKMIKSKDIKKCPIIFMPKLFIIARIVRSRKPNTRNKYIIKNAETDQIVTTNVPTKTRYFTANDMIKTDIDGDFDITIDEALRLNNIERTRNDLDYGE